MKKCVFNTIFASNTLFMALKLIYKIRFLVKPRDYNCLYCCPHFYMAYRGKTKVKKMSFAAFRKEALLYCDSCLKEQYVSLDSSS